MIAALDASTLETVTDVVGIGLVFATVGLLVRWDSQRTKGIASSKSLRIGALVVLVMALGVMGGRFVLLPAARDADRADTAAANPDATTTTSTVPDSTGAAGPDSTEADGPAPTGEPVGPSVTGPTTTQLAPMEQSTTVPATTEAVGDTTTVVPTTVERTTPPPTQAPSTSVVVPSTSTVTSTTTTTTIVDPSTDGGDGQTPGPPPGRGPPDAGSGTDTGVYTVVAGDNLWTIAASVVSAEFGQDASDAQIVGYWTQLIDANTTAIAQSGDADLILPGWTLELPPLTAAGSLPATT